MSAMQEYMDLYGSLGFRFQTGFIYKRVRKTGKVFYQIPGITPNAIQIETGAQSNLTVMDADVRDGINGLAQIKLGWVPEGTPCAQSQNEAGRHFYFLYTPFLRTSTHKERGLDIRNDGGVIYAPPSIVRGGGVYKWLVEPSKSNLRPMSTDLHDFLLALQSPNDKDRTSPKMFHPGMKSITDLTERQQQIIREKLEACEAAHKGQRSEKDFGLCCFAIGADLAPEELWALCQDVGKFSERGRAYFDLTFNNALKAR
jgi:Bifunctional DNA primase/polymerase, N-terminal